MSRGAYFLCKVVAVQTEGLGFEPQQPQKKPDAVKTPVIPAWRKWEQEDSWGSIDINLVKSVNSWWKFLSIIIITTTIRHGLGKWLRCEESLLLLPCAWVWFPSPIASSLQVQVTSAPEDPTSSSGSQGTCTHMCIYTIHITQTLNKKMESRTTKKQTLQLS